MSVHPHVVSPKVLYEVLIKVGTENQN